MLDMGFADDAGPGQCLPDQQTLLFLRHPRRRRVEQEVIARCCRGRRVHCAGQVGKLEQGVQRNNHHADDVARGAQLRGC